MESVTIRVPDKYKNSIQFNSSQTLRLPIGYTASVFYASSNVLRKPRFMAWGPDSVLYVANMNSGSVLALPDLNNDGVADTVIVAANGFSTGHDVRFYRDTMFVAQTSGIVKLWRSDSRTYVFNNRVVVVNKLVQENQSGGNHTTRTLGLDTNNKLLFLSVGSRGNADRETNRALVERYNWDGTNRTTVATGVRNAVGMTIHPRTGKLWANNNGSDNQGNDVPGEWVDIIRENGFYGYPIAYHNKRYFNFTNNDYKDLLPITAADSTRVNSMAPPAAIVEAHSAPMALQFANSALPTTYKNALFMVQRGSWNRTPPSGAKVVVFRFDSDADTIANSVEDFCTGFISDTNNLDTRWGRPVGLELSADGSVYISIDDGKQCILKITPPTNTSINSETLQQGSLKIFPNPSTSSATISWKGLEATLVIINSNGEIVYSANQVSSGVVLSTTLFPAGAYTVIVQNSFTMSAPFIVQK